MSLIRRRYYDDKGRLSTRTQPSKIVETNTYNSHGYLASISAGGATRYPITAMNARQQVTAANHGNSTLLYSTSGLMITDIPPLEGASEWCG